jgi:hypothetical protein
MIEELAAAVRENLHHPIIESLHTGVQQIAALSSA